MIFFCSGIRVRTLDRKASAILDGLQTTTEAQTKTEVTIKSDHRHHHRRHKQEGLGCCKGQKFVCQSKRGGRQTSSKKV